MQLPHSLPAFSFWAALLASAAAATCGKVDKLALQLPRPIQPEYAGFVVPSSEGIAGAPMFSDECLQIKTQGGGPNYDPLHELKAGKADLAIAEGAYVAQKIASGEQLTIVAGYYQKNGLVWIGMNKTLYPTLQELAFKKVGVGCCGYDLAFPAIMKQAKRTVPTTKVSQNEMSMQLLISGDLDLVSAMVYDELARPLQVLDKSSNFLKQQSELYVLNPESYGLTLVHNVLVVETAKLPAMRAKIVRFLKVVTKTWHFCRSNEVACASAFSEYGVPTAHHLWQMREVNRFVFPALAGYGLGVLSLERWAAMNAWLVTTGALTAAVSNTVVDNTLALDAGALNDISQWAPFTKGGLFFCADYGSGTYRICNGNEHTLCKAGEEPSGRADYACKLCQPGRFAPKHLRMNTCLVCPSGRYSRTSGQSECDSCTPGRYWVATSIPKVSITECTSCPMGLFSNEAGASACRPCGNGSIASKTGTTECERCPLGRYADTTSQSACKACSHVMATLLLGSTSQKECVCPQGTYRSLQNSSACLPCPEGMACNVNSLAVNLMTVAADPMGKISRASIGEFPRLLPGYFSERSKPFSVYLCKEDRSCPGDEPQRCGKDMTGLACGKCKAGYFRDGPECLKCSGIDEEDFNYPLLQVVCGPFVVMMLYYFFRNGRQDWGKWWNEVASCAFTLIFHYQVLGLLWYTFLQYPDVLNSMMMYWTYLVDISSMLRLSCSKYGDFHNSLLVRETAPGLLLAVFLLTYGIGLAIGKCMSAVKQQPKDDGTVQGPLLEYWFPLQANLVSNLYFAIFQTFYIAICFVSLQLFMCYKHPTGDYSLLFAPEVFCYSSEDWKGMVTESIFAILAHIAAPIAGFAYVVIVAPSRFHKIGFRERWKFLFIKFKPESFWWGVFHMLRTLLLCLTLVFSQRGSRQVYYIFIMLLVYVGLLVSWFPWRHRTANLFDLLVTCLLLFFCALSAPFSRRYGWLDDELAEFATAVTFSPIVVVVLLVGRVGWSKLSARSVKKRKAKKLELAADCRAVFTKLVGLSKADAQAFVQRISAQDRDVLRNACGVIVAELLGHQPGSIGLPWRLVHGDPHKSGARTWSPASASVGASAAAPTTSQVI